MHSLKENLGDHMRKAGVVFLTTLFLITSVGFSILVIYQNYKSNKDETAQVEAEKARQANMLQGTKLNDFIPVEKTESLQKIDTVVGTGQEAKEGDSVTAHYTGAVASTGIIFQSSLDTGSPVPFSLNGVIDGWKNGVPGMKVGGKRRLVIPAVQAYGSNPPAGSGIPVNADLVFDIELVSIP